MYCYCELHNIDGGRYEAYQRKVLDRIAEIILLSHIDAHGCDEFLLQRKTHLLIRGLHEGAREQSVDRSAVWRLKDAVEDCARNAKIVQGRDLGQGGAYGIEESLCAGADGRGENGRSDKC